jgi:diguanylate cyclase (GGDEF)-like protein
VSGVSEVLGPGEWRQRLLAPAVAVAAAGAAGLVVAAGDAPVAALACAALVGVLVAVVLTQTYRLEELGSRLAATDERVRLDPLTGLLNRTGVVDQIAQRLRRRRPNEVVGVLFVDVDRLKLINDAIGHGAGDEILQTVGQRLAGVLRDGDAVGRLGGDEFVVVASGIRSVVDLERLAARILDELARPVALGDGSRQMATGSIGIAYVLKGTATAESLLRDADVAMYRAKEAGGSRAVVFDAELRAKAAARLELERELRRAVRDGELVVQYQPIVDVASRSVYAVEALVRWRHPTRGLIPPVQFLSVASESGLIIEVGEHVLRSACAQAQAWSAELGRPLAVAVNLAERQLVDHGLVGTVAEVLRATGLPAGQLQLEVAEHLVVDRPARRLEVLRQLAAMGVEVAMDDFGTSRGSLRPLKDLDVVSSVKIDPSFAVDVVGDVVNRKIVTAVVALSESLGMVVVAEGVETSAQAALLAGLGVDRLQGFWFQRPASAEEIGPVLSRPVELPETARA